MHFSIISGHLVRKDWANKGGVIFRVTSGILFRVWGRAVAAALVCGQPAGMVHSLLIPVVMRVQTSQNIEEDLQDEILNTDLDFPDFLENNEVDDYCQAVAPNP